MYRTKIRRVGNSHGVLLPAEIVRRWGLRVGEAIEVAFDADRVILRPASGSRAAFVKALEEVADEDDAILRDLAK
jgi:putative addiction module antidote